VSGRSLGVQSPIGLLDQKFSKYEADGRGQRLALLPSFEEGGK